MESEEALLDPPVFATTLAERLFQQVEGQRTTWEEVFDILYGALYLPRRGGPFVAVLRDGSVLILADGVGHIYNMPREAAPHLRKLGINPETL